ncbi:MAG: hypothetical protein R6V58_15460 [Planctomycetota bacterium]
MCIVQSPKELERIRRMLREAPLVALRERLTDRWILAFSRRMAAAATLRLPFLYDRLLDAVASTPSMFDLDAWNPEPLCGNANITRV